MVLSASDGNTSYTYYDECKVEVSSQNIIFLCLNFESTKNLYHKGVLYSVDWSRPDSDMDLFLFFFILERETSILMDFYCASIIHPMYDRCTNQNRFG